MKFEEEYLDVLQNIEFALLSTCQEHQELCDHDVFRVVEAAIFSYRSQQNSLPIGRLSQPERKMFERVKSICDWRLGKIAPPSPEMACPPISLDEIISCLKRIKKSIEFWTKKGGRRGYITFVSRSALGAPS